ncbi:30S ribosomal protein S8 [Candidatus Woesearchaeota archaeon]|nr:small subunit ribosomal protein S8 [uncultured archaeon]KHO47202.1 MAG: small subunit ribosomal protein S8 [archaeon GW2011_AR4]MBS3129177.1 30S ribosomal protein S8 [Candidatus Woesearchaeota archaeon]HIH37910.1 30S ribosomal protein S8 [Candidatus Woesearchaeota archaeon]HIH48881.1 30S ribosomal protein S8 [Candidatus Woesearchaeota archaeon]
MVMNDSLANCMSKMLNAERANKQAVEISPVSVLIKKVLKLLKDNDYTGDAQEVQASQGIRLTLSLLGKINNCGAIKPRYAIKKEDFEKFEKRYLPAKSFGILILSTTNGLMTHQQAKEKGIGGRLIAYCY